MIEELRKRVSDLLSSDTLGHGMDHVNRVYTLSKKFAEQEKANKDIVAMIALLHDVDDYKLFGEESAKNLTNARKILEEVGVDAKVQEQVLSQIQCLGYSKRLRGIEPTTLEGKIVSDADMCDGIGATGIIRVHSYGLKINRPFFNQDIFPTDECDTEHHLKGNSSSVNFIIASLLEYKNHMLTESGLREAKQRHEVIVDFLYNYFKEENAPEWVTYLDKCLSGTNQNEKIIIHKRD